MKPAMRAYRRPAITAFALACMCVSAHAQTTKPLAYVRSLALLPIETSLKSGADVVAPTNLFGGRPTKKAEAELRAQRDAVVSQASIAVQTASAEVISRIGGVGDIRMVEDRIDLTGAASAAQTDAALAIVIDRCGLHAGIEREVWIRLTGRLVTRGNRVRGPFYGVGLARSNRKLIGKGYSHSDVELVAIAARRALSQMAREMRTGERPPFAAGGRILVVRADTPRRVRKVIAADGGEGHEESVEVPSLVRQSDVLFQPDLPPVVDLVDPDEADSALKSEEAAPSDLWGSDGSPNLEMLKKIAMKTDANFVFISRLRDIAFEERPVDVPDGTMTKRAGIERSVDATVAGALYSASEQRILWQDLVEGGTIARTEYVRHKPRIRTDEQAVMDAAHTAYAYLRYGLDEFHRRYYR